MTPRAAWAVATAIGLLCIPASGIAKPAKTPGNACDVLPRFGAHARITDVRMPLVPVTGGCKATRFRGDESKWFVTVAWFALKRHEGRVFTMAQMDSMATLGELDGQTMLFRADYAYIVPDADSSAMLSFAQAQELAPAPKTIVRALRKGARQL
ncbi:MAG: hypothetical protein K8R56_05890 [Candidatus Eisenbacteria bacterium]|nr:hypothetical protein [Candidatus Eisenbacteria bacterium]